MRETSNSHSAGITETVTRIIFRHFLIISETFFTLLLFIDCCFAVAAGYIFCKYVITVYLHQWEESFFYNFTSKSFLQNLKSKTKIKMCIFNHVIKKLADRSQPIIFSKGFSYDNSGLKKWFGTKKTFKFSKLVKM